MNELMQRMKAVVKRVSDESPGVTSHRRPDVNTREITITYSQQEMLVLMLKNDGFAFYTNVQFGHVNWCYSIPDGNHMSNFNKQTLCALGARGLIAPVVWSIQDNDVRFKHPTVVCLTLRGEALATALGNGVRDDGDTYQIPEDAWADTPSPNCHLKLSMLLRYCGRLTLRVVKDFPVGQVELWNDYPSVEWTEKRRRDWKIMLETQREQAAAREAEEKERKRIERNLKVKLRRQRLKLKDGLKT